MGRGDDASDSSEGRFGLSNRGEGGDVVINGGPATRKSNWHMGGASALISWSGSAVVSSGVGRESTELTVSKLSVEEDVDNTSMWVDSMSEWASVYFEVLISSSKGLRKETFF